MVRSSAPPCSAARWKCPRARRASPSWQPFARVGRPDLPHRAELPMRRILALLVLATAAACGGSDGTAPSQTQAQGKSFVGSTYLLQNVNGKPLPYTWTYGSGDYLTIRTYRLSIGTAG